MGFSYFPEMYQDELLYSACARYQRNIGSKVQKSHIQNLFGVRSCCAITDLPSHLSYFCDKLTYGGMNVEKLILKHTTYPYYHPFLPQETARSVQKYMLSGIHGNRIHMSLGISACSIPKAKYLRFCKKCVENDLETHGVTYWRRVHQLPGVSICSDHCSLLTNSKIVSSTSRGKHNLIDLNTVYQLGGIEEIEDSGLELLLDIAKRSSQLLQSQYDEFLNKNTMRSLYLERLDESGYMTPTGRVRFKLLISDFMEFYSPLFLTNLKSNIKEGDGDSWLHKVIRKSKENCHPLRHILLLKFLGVTLDHVRSLRKPRPFGDSPWPCLNKAASHYLESVVEHCTVTTGSKTKKPTGHFHCDCGFVYIRTGPDLFPEDRYKRGRIETFGSVWLQAAQELSLKSVLSLRQKAKRLGVDPKTFVRFLKGVRKEKIELPRAIPKRRITLKQRSTTKNTSRVNWQKRDGEMSERVVISVQELLSQAKPTRITKSKLIKQAELHSSIVYYPEKLPKTSRIIHRFTESIEDFQIRRIDWAIKLLSETNELKEWKVRRVASITNKCSSRVQDYLKLELVGLR